MWLANKPPKSLLGFASLAPLVIRHILASNKILKPEESAFFKSRLKVLLDAVQESISNTAVVQEALNQFTQSLSKCSAKDIPPSILTLLHVAAKHASQLHNIAYPPGTVARHGDGHHHLRTDTAGTLVPPERHRDSPAVCAMVDALIRLGFGEFLILAEHSRSSSDTRVHLSNLLKQLGAAVWRLPRAPRFSLNEARAAGSDDREAFLLSQAEQLCRWAAAALLHQHTPFAIRVDVAAVEQSILESLKGLCDHLVRLDGDVWKGTLIIPSQEGRTVQEFIDKIRNYDKIILFAMTHGDRQTQLFQ